MLFTTAILKKILLPAMLLMSMQAAVAQPADCYRFKEGKFKVADPNAGGLWLVERRGNHQTESHEGLKLTLKFKVIWLNDCSLILELESVLRNDNKLPLPKTTTIAIKILSTSKNSCIQEVTSSLQKQTYQCELVKLQ
jgi:hypothetical protein